MELFPPAETHIKNWCQSVMRRLSVPTISPEKSVLAINTFFPSSFPQLLSVLGIIIILSFFVVDWIELIFRNYLYSFWGCFIFFLFMITLCNKEIVCKYWEYTGYMKTKIVCEFSLSCLIFKLLWGRYYKDWTDMDQLRT